MARFKTVVYEEVTVYDVSYQKYHPSRPYYDGGDGPGSCHAARDAWYGEDRKTGLTMNEKNRLVRYLKRLWRPGDGEGKDRGPTSVRSRKVWKAVSEKIGKRGPKAAKAVPARQAPEKPPARRS